MSRKGRAFAILATVIALGVAGAFFLQPKPEFRVIGENPLGLRAIPTAQMNSKPWISIGEFQFPKVVKAPNGFDALDTTLAGVLLPAIGKEKGEGWATSQLIFDFGPDGRRSLDDSVMSDEWAPAFIPCPSVLGFEPREVTIFSPRHDGPPRKVKVRLPASGNDLPLEPSHFISVPRIKVTEQGEEPAGKWDITFKPAKRLSAVFHPTYEVRVTNLGPGELVAVEVMPLGGYSIDRPICSIDQPGVFEAFGDDPNDRQVVVYSLIKETFKLRVEKKIRGTWTLVKLFLEDGELLYKDGHGSKVYSENWSGEVDNRYWAWRIGSWTNRGNGFFADAWDGSLDASKLSDGQILEAEGYRRTEYYGTAQFKALR